MPHRKIKFKDIGTPSRNKKRSISMTPRLYDIKTLDEIIERWRRKKTKIVEEMG